MGWKNPHHTKRCPCARPTVTRSWGQFPQKKKKKKQERGSISSNNCAKRKKQRANEKHQTQKTITSARQRQFRLQNCQTKKDFEFQLQREGGREREREGDGERRVRCSSFRFSLVRFGLISPLCGAHPSAHHSLLSLRFWSYKRNRKTCTDVHGRVAAWPPGHAHTTDHHKS